LRPQNISQAFKKFSNEPGWAEILCYKIRNHKVSRKPKVRLREILENLGCLRTKAALGNVTKGEPLFWGLEHL